MQRRILTAAMLLLLGAAPPALRPGLWQFTNVPTGASLDGRALGDLPYTPPSEPQTVCLTPEQAARPARWFARDSGVDCVFSRERIAGGTVDIVASCPPATAGHDRGTLRLAGRWTPTSYDLTFDTLTHSENGHMGFAGTMAGRRIGDCPPAR